ncbi:RNA polymerase sigma-70 factor [Actinokineospora enzanensis]|uniref:RNA polymerase sigma-70 factor n=1 Tax=Actinokineospora enzanensis TaxID=155975 RepID=UPI00039FA9C5|nr:RNA polymerase sigma-70 factor [Actinokineospora enzanensis]
MTTAEVFADHRDLLFSVAYRVLGRVADAEDAVQDALVKWLSADRSQVADPKSYLVRIVSNAAIDRLRSAQHRRETYIGPWIPEPVRTDPDTVEVAESVSIALLMVLETLSPIERAVYVLKEAFGFSHAEIADAVDRTETAVRQAAHRAREHVQARRPRFTATRARQREVTERFLAAVGGGDINELMDLLAPDVTLWTDGGGKVRAAVKPVSGADRVAAWFAGIATRPYQGVLPAEMSVQLVDLNGAPGVVFSGAGRVIATLTFDLAEDGRVTAIHNVANPDKLGATTTPRALPT